VAPLRRGRQRVIGAESEAPLRAAAARTFERLVTAIGHALLTVLAVDARGCFAHCGYALPGHLL
jgi:hypothetical protein